MVCAANESRRNPRLIGPLVEQYCGLMRQDAMVQVSRGMGILAEDLFPERAAQLVEDLAENGVEAFAVAQDSVPEPGPPAKLHRVVDVREESIVLQPVAGAEPQPVPWNALVAGVATQPQTAPPTNVTKTSTTVYVGNGRSVDVSVSKRSAVQPAKWNAALVLRNRQGAVKVFGVTEKNVQFSYMGSRALPLAELSFPHFLEDVTRCAPHAFFTDGFRAAARGQRMRVTRVASPRHQENLVRWALCCAVHRGLFDEG